MGFSASDFDENMHVATLFAVVSAFLLALFPKPGDPWSWATSGKGGMIFMLIMPAWALLIQIGGWWNEGSFLLLFIAVVTLALEAWMIVEAFLMFPQAKGILEEALPPLPSKAQSAIAAVGTNAKSC